MDTKAKEIEKDLDRLEQLLIELEKKDHLHGRGKE